MLAFIEKARQERLLVLLNSPRRREDVRRELATTPRFDPRYVTRLPGSLQTIETITRLFASLKSRPECYLVSENRAWDGALLKMEEAFTKVVGAGWGTVVFCRTGDLGYYEGESAGDRLVLSLRPETVRDTLKKMG